MLVKFARNNEIAYTPLIRYKCWGLLWKLPNSPASIFCQDFLGIAATWHCCNFQLSANWRNLALALPASGRPNKFRRVSASFRGSYTQAIISICEHCNKLITLCKAFYCHSVSILSKVGGNYAEASNTDDQSCVHRDNMLEVGDPKAHCFPLQGSAMQQVM